MKQSLLSTRPQSKYLVADGENAGVKVYAISRGKRIVKLVGRDQGKGRHAWVPVRLRIRFGVTEVIAFAQINAMNAFQSIRDHQAGWAKVGDLTPEQVSNATSGC